MYAIAKWCLWASRLDMHRLHWTSVTLSGMDLEPQAEHMPAFVYRRALQIIFDYENLYYNSLAGLGKYTDIIDNPGGPLEDPDLGDGTWRLCPEYYSERISGYAI